MEKEKSFSEQIDNYIDGKYNRYDDFKVCDTPAIFLVAGCEQKPMIYTQNHFKKAIMPKDIKKHRHGLTTDFIKRVPEMLKDPVMILDSTSRSDSMVVVLSSRETDVDKCLIVATVHPNGSGMYELETVDSNFITSLYGRENFADFIQHSIEQDKILYYKNKKSQELFSLLGLQFPEGLNNLDPDTVIHQSRNIVKTVSKNISLENKLNDEMSAEKMLERYNEIEKEIRKMNFQNLSERDREILNEYAEMKNFFTDIAHSVDFISNSMTSILETDGSIKTESMISVMQYAQNITDLTNGLDKNFMQTIQQEQYKGIPIDEHLERIQMSNAIRESVMEIAVVRSAINSEGFAERTAGDIKRALERTEELMKIYGIDKENAYEETSEKFRKLHNENQLLTVVDERESSPEKEEKPVTIVESNDGYVMNTSDKITAENSKELSENNSVENVNEVRHDMAKETTNNLADVRPNVKLEQAKDIGSKEKTEIDSGYGTDTDIDIAARNSAAYHSQTERANTKPKSKGTER